MARHILKPFNRYPYHSIRRCIGFFHDAGHNIDFGMFFLFIKNQTMIGVELVTNFHIESLCDKAPNHSLFFIRTKNVPTVLHIKFLITTKRNFKQIGGHPHQPIAMIIISHRDRDCSLNPTLILCDQLVLIPSKIARG